MEISTDWEGEVTFQKKTLSFGQFRKSNLDFHEIASKAYLVLW